MAKTLTTRQQVFVERYLVGFNGAEAARLAGYSAHTANEQAARLLADVRVKAQIAARIAELKATTDEVLLRLASHSRGDMGRYLTPMGLINLDSVREHGKSHLVKKIKQRTTTISKQDGEDIETHEIELELYDAQAATVQLAKLLGMFPSVKVEVSDLREKADSDLVAEFNQLVSAGAAPTR